MIEATTAQEFRDQVQQLYGWVPKTYIVPFLTKRECLEYGRLLGKEEK